VKREKTLNPFPRKEKLLLPFPTLGSRRDLVFGDRLIDVINDFKRFSRPADLPFNIVGSYNYRAKWIGLRKSLNILTEILHDTERKNGFIPR
jgi:hypothetical protein